MSPNDIERRVTPSETAIEYRAFGDNGEKKPVITGYAAVFDSESRILNGRFVEVIRRNAFDKVLSAKPDVVGVYNHDKNFLLGRTGNGTMRLSVDDIGLRYEIDPPATRADVVESVQRGDVVGSSFAFLNKEGSDQWSTRSDGLRMREVREIAMLDDVGPVVRPAYERSSVVVSRRALEFALGEQFRPNQTMANAAKRGLKLAARAENIDSALISLAERVSAREIVSIEEVSYLSGVFTRCLEAKASSWSGTPAWIEWQLAGGDSGLKWVQRRNAELEVPEPAAEPRAESSISLKPTAGMAAACRRGLKLYEAGRGGDGLVPATISWARKIAARESLTEEKVVKMRAWFARHKVDKRPGWDKPGEESAGFVAYLLWGGEAGRRFSESKVAQLERMGKRAMANAVDGEEMEGEEGVGAESAYGTLSEANLDLAEAQEEIVAEDGKWSQELPGGAHYMERSAFQNEGLVCANCVFYDAGACELVDGKINENGLCKLWIIPEEKMTLKRSEEAVVEVAESAVAEEKKPDEPDYVAQIAAMKLAALQSHLHGE